MDGETVCRTEIYKTSFAETGEYYVTIVAENRNGKTEEEIRIDVVELTPPAVELKIPAEVLKVLVNTDYSFDPVYQFDDIDGFSVEWILDGKKVGTEKKYTFRADRIGRQTLTLKASNDDGVTEKSIEIEVVEKMPYSVEFLRLISLRKQIPATLLPDGRFCSFRDLNISIHLSSAGLSMEFLSDVYPKHSDLHLHRRAVMR